MIFDWLFFVALFIILLALSAFFSGAETSYFSLSPGTVQKFEKSSHAAERRVAQLLQNPRQLLITIVVGNTIVNITTASIAAILTARFSQAVGINEKLGIFIDVVVVTFVLLIVSEIIPKVVAVRDAARFSARTSPFLKFFYLLIYPIGYFLANFTRFLQNRIGLTESKLELTEDEIAALADVGMEHGTFQRDEREMIHSIMEFKDTTVKEIMIPRTDMVCIEANATLSDLMKLVKTKLHSRIPVYRDRIDNIIGILYVKDLLPYLTKRRREKLDMSRLARKPHFVPEQKKIKDLLREFQQEKVHMALVVDEYGGIAGLVTLEDVIEEIVGEIQDEYDRETPLYKKVDENTYVVDGRMSLAEINEELHLDLPLQEGVETISGFILNLLGSLPKKHERITHDKYLFVVEDVARHRILKVRIEKMQPDVKVEDNVPG